MQDILESGFSLGSSLQEIFEFLPGLINGIYCILIVVLDSIFEYSAVEKGQDFRRNQAV